MTGESKMNLTHCHGRDDMSVHYLNRHTKPMIITHEYYK